MLESVDGHKVIYDSQQLADALTGETIIAFDTETTGLSPFRSKLALMQFYGATTGVLGIIRLTNGVIPPPIKALFTPPHQRTFIAHNGVMFDLLFLLAAGVDITKVNWFDTLVAEGVVQTTGRRDVSKSLRDSVRRRLNIDIDKTIEHSWSNASLTDEQIAYAANDVLHLYELSEAQISRAQEFAQHKALMMEMRLVPVFARMAFNGLPLRPSIIEKYTEEQQGVVDQQTVKLRTLLGPINFNSPVQLKKAIHYQLGLDWTSTSFEELTDISQLGGAGSDIATELLTLRGASQRCKMYSQSWIAEHIDDNRVHPRYWQVGTDTGRVSCSDPNLQQIPRDGRSIIGNIPGLSIVSCDYSQIEVRIAAFLAHDSVMQTMLQSEDFHSTVASQILNKPLADVTKAERKLSKACSFTLLFGGGSQRLYDYARRSGSTDLTKPMADDIVKRFFASFSGIAALKQKAIARSRMDIPVVVTMPNGFRRVLVGENKTVTRILNTAVQGFAAVGLKNAMIKCDAEGLTQYLSCAVHDELVLAVPDADMADAGETLKRCMIDGMREYLEGGVRVELSSGNHW